MLEDENDAQADADGAWNEEAGDCEDKATQLQGEIDDATEQIAQNNANIDILNSAVAGSQASLDEANDKLVTSTNALQNLVDARESEHATFLQNIADISATITALQQGKDILSKLQVEDASEESEESEEGEAVPEGEEGEEESFMQKKVKGTTAFSQFTSHITNANLKKSTKYHGFVTALLTMLSRQSIVADQALVDQIIRLIESLVDQLSAELTTLAANENDAQLVFETQQTYLSSDISDLNAQIADLQSDITDKSAQSADLSADNANLQVNIENKTQELADSQQTCSDDQSAYETTSEQRAGEIDIIEQVINIFQTRFDNVQGYLTESSF
jgi:chromosome segregation ATPase